MNKELVISLGLIIFIVTVNYYARSYTQKSMEEVIQKLESVKVEMLGSGEETKKEYEELETLWNEKYEKLAYYIEHDELEKVSSELAQLKGSIQTSQKDEGIPTIENCKFILEHIKDKDKFEIKNIF